jgi:hypothetical protein
MNTSVDAWYAERFGTKDPELDKAFIVLRHVKTKIDFARREHQKQMDALAAELKAANDQVMKLMRK